MVSIEENGKSKTYKTYRNLDIEYNKKRKKRADREIKDTDSERNLSRYAPSPRFTDETLHLSPLFPNGERISYSHYRLF